MTQIQGSKAPNPLSSKCGATLERGRHENRTRYTYGDLAHWRHIHGANPRANSDTTGARIFYSVQPCSAVTATAAPRGMAPAWRVLRLELGRPATRAYRPRTL